MIKFDVLFCINRKKLNILTKIGHRGFCYKNCCLEINTPIIMFDTYDNYSFSDLVRIVMLDHKVSFNISEQID